LTEPTQLALTGWIDTHCHLDAPEFAHDLPAVVARARAAGVTMLVLPCVQVAHIDVVRNLAQRFGLAYALGIHPLCVGQAGEADLQTLRHALQAYANDPHLVAVGEIGLDHFVEGLDRDRQAFFYRAQLTMARDAGLPVILHVRRSADSVLAGLRRIAVVGGIAHAFNGSAQQANAFVQRGFALGFGGAMTFERALQIRRLATSLPSHSVVLETDAPDIPPHWLYRTQAERVRREVAPETAPNARLEAGPVSSVQPSLAQARNEPAELPAIAAVLAQLRGVDLPTLCAQTHQAACLALPRLAELLSAKARVPA
jgi:TatD DNase family protein